MTEQTPTRVGLYTQATDPPRQIAIFRYEEKSGVTLELLDPDWGHLAQTYFLDGVSLHEEKRMVRPNEGPVFMRALLRQRNMSYYTLQDESQT